MEEIGCQIILGNTYHLELSPGADLINELGGRHFVVTEDAKLDVGFISRSFGLNPQRSFFGTDALCFLLPTLLSQIK